MPLVHSLHRADELARTLGAVIARRSLYPYRMDVPRGPFAEYYFNLDGLEVGYYLYDTDCFIHLPELRKWNQFILNSLTPERELIP